MKRMSLRTIYVSLASLALVFSLAGCAKTTVQPENEIYRTGQAEVRESAPEQDRKNTASGWTDMSQKAGQGLDRIAASSNAALKKMGIHTGYNQEEKNQFLMACQQACVKEGPKTKEISQFCNLYCGCTHDNLEAQVPFEDLQAYTMDKTGGKAGGKTGKSGTTIEQIKTRCIQDSHTAVNHATDKKS